MSANPPPVSGFTIVRNGIRMDYPFVESMRSLLPLVDELVVAVGDSTDGTLPAVESLAAEFPGKVRIVPSPWDPQRTANGEELARQTNIALAACAFDICFYLQADEVLHEEDYPLIREDLARFGRDDALDALAFRWVHFYGGYFTVVHSKRWYRREIRVIKRSRGFRSFGDAQSFRLWNPATETFGKSRAALSRARVLHYGWAKEEDLMRSKFAELQAYWGKDPEAVKKQFRAIYNTQFGLAPFAGTHPRVMRPRASEPQTAAEWMQHAPKRDRHYWRYWATDLLERAFDWRPGEFRSYRSLEKF